MEINVIYVVTDIKKLKNNLWSVHNKYEALKHLVDEVSTEYFWIQVKSI